MSGTLLTTKLYVPQITRELVPRPRLTQRMNQGLTRKLTLISAPAGFGKSTLVTGWLAETGHNTFYSEVSKTMTRSRVSHVALVLRSTLSPDDVSSTPSSPQIIEASKVGIVMLNPEGWGE